MNPICHLNERNGSFFNARQVKYFFRRLRYDSENSCSTWIIFGLFILFELKKTLLRPLFVRIAKRTIYEQHTNDIPTKYEQGRNQVGTR
jgi:hypothetical protein